MKDEIYTEIELYQQKQDLESWKSETSEEIEELNFDSLSFGAEYE